MENPRPLNPVLVQARKLSIISKGHLVRLACLRHAASVHPEPGSNSQKYIYFIMFVFPSYSNNLDVLLSFQRSFPSSVLQKIFTLFCQVQ